MKYEKIAVFIEYLDVYGGIVRVTTNLAAELAKYAKVSIVARGGSLSKERINWYSENAGTFFSISNDEKKDRNMLRSRIGVFSKKRLAEIYTVADWFVNPTYEDNYPTVNLEAIACGTKVIIYDTV